MVETAFERVNDFTSVVRISLASPEDIRSWSYGESEEAGDHQLPDVPRREDGPSASASSAPSGTGNASAASIAA